MPTGSRVERFSITYFIGAPSSPSNLSYNPNGNDASHLLAWLETRGLTATQTEAHGAPASFMQSYRDSVVLFVGPKPSG